MVKDTNDNNTKKTREDYSMEIKLIVDNTEFVMGAGFQQRLVDIIPDTPLYSDIFHILSQSGDAEVRSDLAYKDNLKEETVALLLEDKDTNVLNRILNNSTAEGIVTTEQLISFVNNGNTDIVKTIIQNLLNYENVDIDKVVDEILDMNNPSLALTLAEGWSVPKRILKRLVESDDPDISYAAKKSLE